MFIPQSSQHRNRKYAEKSRAYRLTTRTLFDKSNRNATVKNRETETGWWYFIARVKMWKTSAVVNFIRIASSPALKGYIWRVQYTVFNVVLDF
jgi:hypothetical protein